VRECEDDQGSAHVRSEVCFPSFASYNDIMID
jgi:hypothetical protein